MYGETEVWPHLVAPKYVYRAPLITPLNVPSTHKLKSLNKSSDQRIMFTLELKAVPYYVFASSPLKQALKIKGSLKSNIGDKTEQID